MARTYNVKVQGELKVQAEDKEQARIRAQDRINRAAKAGALNFLDIISMQDEEEELNERVSEKLGEL